MAVSIALDVGGTNIKMALVQHGRIMDSLIIPVADNNELGPLLPVLEDHIQTLLSKSQGEMLKGIGLAFPSIVDSRSNLILSEYVKYQDINELNLGNWANEKWGAPVLFENDARAALVGEWQYGAGKGYENLVQVTIGTGVGSAVLSEGRLVRGKHYLAGNLGGHMTIKYDGNLCNCGNRGCVETVASTWALPDIVKAADGFDQSRLKDLNTIDFKGLFGLAAEGDPLAISIREHCIEGWSFGLINLVHAFDPECIIIGGGIASSKEILFPVFREMINKHTWLPPDTVTLIAAEYKDTAALLGLDYLIKNETNN